MIKALLTIDDVSSKNTPAIVDYLCEKNIQAIMFMVGQWAENYPDQLVYALKHGMIVGNHSYTHPHFSELSFEECKEEIEKNEVSRMVIREAAIRTFFRCILKRTALTKSTIQSFSIRGGKKEVWIRI